MAEKVAKLGLGWLPDYPDFRDYTVDQNSVAPKLQLLKQGKSIKDMRTEIGVAEVSRRLTLSASIDLRPWCSPVEDQGSLGSCTAQAGAGVVEYFEKRAFGKHIDASRLFLYKVTRNLMHSSGDSGAFLRSTMGALTLFGVPPEEYWLYSIPDFDKEPPAFCYAFAQNYQAITYYRLDPYGTPKDVLLTRIKTDLGAGLPPMFGFTVYSSISQGEKTGAIPYPTPGERILGGHAVVAVGYDDAKTIKNSNPGGAETKGALLIRNSWGVDWGDDGYGWLPYDYVLRGLAVDWWSLLKNEWVDTGQFKR